MSIDQRHATLPRTAADWLIDACNPFAGTGTPAVAPSADSLPALLRAAELHGVQPFVLKRIRQLETASGLRQEFAAEVLAAIETARNLQINQAAMELMLRHHGARVLTAFANADIPAAIVKGPTFADRLYQHPAMRTFTDIDVLIPLSKRKQTRSAMESLGFEPYERDYRAERDYFEDVWLLRSDHRVSIEVHSDLVHNPRLRARASLTFEDLVKAGDGDPNEASALLYVAAVHAAMSHQFDRLQHLLDVALATSGAAGSIDWQRLRRVSDRTGTRRALFVAVELAAAVFGEPALSRLGGNLKPGLGDRIGALLVSRDTVLEARSDRRSHKSWRRKLLRRMLAV